MIFAAARLFQFWNELTLTRAPAAATLLPLPIWSNAMRKGRKAKEKTEWYNRYRTF